MLHERVMPNLIARFKDWRDDRVCDRERKERDENENERAMIAPNFGNHSST
jgi:hypothetical protein